jgi:Predicted periplasmic ligand-binding sensor domain
MRTSLAFVSASAADPLFAVSTASPIPSAHPRVITVATVEASRWRADHYSTEDGLSHGLVWTILQDELGFLWLATKLGIDRFDGYTFKSYRYDPTRTNTLAGASVHALFRDRNGALWIGGDHFHSKFDPVTECFTSYDRGQPETVRSIVQDNSGMIWLATKAGLAKLDPSTRQYTYFQGDSRVPQSLGRGEIFSVTMDNRGRIWVASTSGTYVLDPRMNNVTLCPNFGNTIDRIFEDRSGTLWFTSRFQGGGLIAMDTTGATVRYLFDKDQLNTVGITQLSQDSQGSLWFGTLGAGLMRFDPAEKTFTRYRKIPGDPSSLSEDTIGTVMIDREGNVWAATGQSGVNRLSTRPSPFTIYTQQLGNPNSLRDANILSVLRDTYGDLWIGGNTGLSRINRKTGKFTFYRHNPNDSRTISTDMITAIIEDNSGVLWFGTYGGGLDRFDRQTGAFRHYQQKTGDSTTAGRDFIIRMKLDLRGNLWITTNNGLNRFSIARGVFTPISMGSSAPREFSALTVDPNGSIWLGPDQGGGLYHYDPATGKCVVYPSSPRDPTSLGGETVEDLLIDPSGTLWVGTRAGLYRRNGATNTFKRYSSRDGLPSDTVVSILSDEHGNLWMGTTNGLSEFRTATGEFRNYYVSDGIAGNQFSNWGGLQRHPMAKCSSRATGVLPRFGQARSRTTRLYHQSF